MRPANLKDFDLVAVPAHDRPSADPRIIPTLGAPHALTADALTEAVARADPAFRQLPRPRIALLLGGKTQSIAFGTEEATALGNRVNVLASGLSGSVLATTSPRTPSAGADAIEKALLVPHVFHRFAATGANPYRAFLGLADRVVVTSDSASMLSEACAAGCPVHVATLNGTPAKLRALIQDLTERGHIQPWTAEATSTAMPLDEAGRLASVILERLAARSGGAKPLSGRGSVPSPHPL